MNARWPRCARNVTTIVSLFVGVACGGGAPAGRARVPRTPSEKATARITPESTEREAVPMDTRIARAVESELAVDPAVDASLVSVDVDDGVVELSGEVPNLLMAQSALERAEMVAGVKAVVNRVEVSPSDRPDATIRSDVEDALRVDPATARPPITIRVLNGVVTLGGTTGSFVEKRLAERAARSVRGVRDVVDRIEVRYPGQRADAEILADVRGALRADRWVDEWLLETEVDQGVVTLRGVQPTAYAKRRAIDDARVMGVRDVDATLLDVDPELQADRRRPPANYRYPDDREIASSIRAGLAHDPRLSARTIDVSVREGIVTLTGYVGSLAARDAAAETANSVRGVWRVDDRLLVEGGPRDASLERKAESALARTAAIDESAIDVSVHDGVATLRGAVISPFAKSMAATVVRTIPGIRDLDDQIEAPPRIAEPLSDAELTQNVVTHLATHPYVAPDQIEVHVSNGSVILRGDVDDWRAKEEAVRAAYEAGATDVLDDITVAHPGDRAAP